VDIYKYPHGLHISYARSLPHKVYFKEKRRRKKKKVSIFVHLPASQLLFYGTNSYFRERKGFGYFCERIMIQLESL